MLRLLFGRAAAHTFGRTINNRVLGELKAENEVWVNARDARERGYIARDTISRWESVRRGEKNYIFPFQENADVMFNSALVFELAVLRPLAEPLLRQVPHGTPEYIEAKRLLAFLEWFLPINFELIPENSIAREFLGGSILRNFTLWKDKHR